MYSVKLKLRLLEVLNGNKKNIKDEMMTIDQYNS